jgi:hypothetical protein
VGLWLGVKQDELLANDVHRVLGDAELGRILGQDADADIDGRVEQERSELRHRDAD